MTCSDGLVGWGEPVIEEKADTVDAAVEEMAGRVIGKDPRQIEDIWQTLYRGGFYQGGPILMGPFRESNRLCGTSWEKFRVCRCTIFRVVLSVIK